MAVVALAIWLICQGSAAIPPAWAAANLDAARDARAVCAAACSADARRVATQPLQPADYRASALHQSGSASHGKALFNDARFACTRCHTVDGTGGTVGPDLLSIGDKYPRLGLIQSILQPSSNILPGYSTTIVTTKSGEVYDGTRREISPTEIELRSTAGAVRVQTRDIRETKTSSVSPMPEGLQLGMTLREFADLIAYLETLKQPAPDHRAGAGTPDVIQSVGKPIQLRPYHDAALRFEHPVWFSPLPGFSNTFVILEHQRARVWLLEKDPAGDRKTLFGDFNAEVSDGPFEGLVAIAFHPKFRENRKYYLKHEVIENKQRSTVVVEKQAAEDFKKDSGSPSRRLLKIDQPAENHNGGTIAFGPDGYLYIGMGDGGPQEDPLGRSQSPYEWLGKMLRIDVDRAENGKPYGIPPTNPVRQNANPAVKPEIWAFGFREPWRFSFDRETGDLWVGDVGQNHIEEVTIVRAGENHGWNVYEGFESFSDRYRRAGVVYTPPVVSLQRKHGVSVTGGFVYRGDSKSSFHGVYIFGDFESRRIWGLTQESRTLTKIRQLATSPARIASFGEDDEGELYLVGYDDGMIYQLDLQASVF